MSTPSVPPPDDEPLDAIEAALVRLCVKIIVAEIRDELAAESSGDPVTPDEPFTTGDRVSDTVRITDPLNADTVRQTDPLDADTRRKHRTSPATMHGNRAQQMRTRKEARTP